MAQDVSQELLGLRQRQATGTLVVESSGQQWQLYFFMGRLLYATGGAQRVRRWQRVLKAHCPQFQPDWSLLAQATPWEYQALVQGMTNGRLTPSQAKAMILASVLEVLFALVGHPHERLTWQGGQGLSTQIALLQVERVLEEVAQLQQQWQASKIASLFPPGSTPSPDWAPVLRPGISLPETVGGVAWRNLLNGQHSLWDVMSLTRKSLATILQTLVPWGQQGWLEWRTLPDVAAPVLESPTAPLPVTRPVATPDEPPLIACLDDSPVMLKILETSLVRAGYRVMTLTDPILHMAQLLEAKPAVILMDWMMPNVNGYELCGLLRKTTAFKNTPIVVITAHESILNRTRARLAGVTETLKKPVQADELLKLVQRYAPLRQAVPAISPPPQEGIPASPEMPEPEPVTDHLPDPVAQANQLLRRYAAGERDFSGICLIGCNLQGANLEGINLSRANLMLADLSGCLLTGAKLTGANLIGAELVKANLREANLGGANLIGANLSQANLNGSQLMGANLSTATLCQAHLRGADLSEALVAGANLTSADLRQAVLYATNLHGAVLNQANLEQANLTGANLWQVQMEHTCLKGANFTGAVLPQTLSD